jgi:hypothetical protein
MGCTPATPRGGSESLNGNDAHCGAPRFKPVRSAMAGCGDGQSIFTLTRASREQKDHERALRQPPRVTRLATVVISTACPLNVHVAGSQL